MIYKNLKAVFVRIPKNASLSIAEALIKFDSETHVYPDDYPIHNPHLTLREITQLVSKNDRYVECRSGYSRMFKFAFVRNPYDRLVSLYEFYIQQTSKDRQIPENMKEFNSFVKTISVSDSILDWYRIRLPQVRWVDGCNFVGKIENIDKDFSYVCSVLKITPAPLGTKHKSGHQHYSRYYNEESYDFVTKIEKDTLRRFEYRFEKLNS